MVSCVHTIWPFLHVKPLRYSIVLNNQYTIGSRFAMGCWHAAAWLAVLLLATATAQPLSAQLQATAPPAVKYPLYNYTLNNQTLFTACRCMDMWTYTLANGSVAQFSGCANPNNDPAVSGQAELRSACILMHCHCTSPYRLCLGLGTCRQQATSGRQLA